MNAKTARMAGKVLFGALLIAIGGIIYLEWHGQVMPGIALVCFTFVLLMGLLWTSEMEDRETRTSEEKRASSPNKQSRSRLTGRS